MTIQDYSDFEQKQLLEPYRFFKNLSAVAIAAMGLKEMLWAAGKVFEIKSGIKFKYVYTNEFFSIGSAYQDLMICKIFQEVLMNIMQHAQATTVYCMVVFETNEIEFSIVDNGLGFSVEESKTKNTKGLTYLRDCAKMLGAKLNIETIIGQGTEISVIVPIHV